PLHISLFSYLSIYHLAFVQLQVAHLRLVGINVIIASFLRSKRSIEYLGQVNMLALITILFLLPIMIVNSLIAMSECIVVSYLLLLTVFIIKEYFRRMKYANIFLRSLIATNL